MLVVDHLTTSLEFIKASTSEYNHPTVPPPVPILRRFGKSPSSTSRRHTVEADSPVISVICFLRMKRGLIPVGVTSAGLLIKKPSVFMVIIRCLITFLQEVIPC